MLFEEKSQVMDTYCYENVSPYQFRWGNYLNYLCLTASIIVHGIDCDMVNKILEKNILSLNEFILSFLKDDWQILKENGNVKDDKLLMYQLLDQIENLHRIHLKEEHFNDNALNKN